MSWIAGRVGLGVPYSTLAGFVFDLRYFSDGLGLVGVYCLLWFIDVCVLSGVGGVRVYGVLSFRLQVVSTFRAQRLGSKGSLPGLNVLLLVKHTVRPPRALRPFEAMRGNPIKPSTANPQAPKPRNLCIG